MCLLKMRALGCNSFHIGGGEPFLKPDSLSQVLQIAGKLKMYVEYVETNSSWFHNSDAAIKLLRELGSKGLETCLISISPFHNEFIPFYKVKGVIDACYRTGVKIFPWIYEFYDYVNSFDDRSAHQLSEYRQKFGDEYISSAAWHYHLSIRGRALNLLRPWQIKFSAGEIVEASRGGCRELADTGHFHMDLFSNYVPGLCAGLSIQVEDLGKQLDPQKYNFLTALFAEGIGKLFNIAQDEYGFTPRPEYTSKCDLCTDIRSFLVTQKSIDTPDLQPLEHYRFGY
jgi:hypothetical protein